MEEDAVRVVAASLGAEMDARKEELTAAKYRATNIEGRVVISNCQANGPGQIIF